MAKRKANINEVAHGLEPTFAADFAMADHEYKIQFTKLLNWYAAARDNKEKKKYFVDWAIAAGYAKEIAQAVPDVYVASVGAVFRAIKRGFPINVADAQKTVAKAEELMERFKPVAEAKVERKARAEDPADKKLGAAMTTFDNFIDGILYGARTTDAPKHDDTFNGVQQKELIAHYKAELADINKALAGDEEYVEAYPHGKRVLNRLVKAYNSIIEQIEGAIAVRVARKPRKRKVKTADALIAKVKYQKQYPAWNLVSIDPAKIIGASKLIVFNTKTRKLGIYHATSVDGFSVKGTTLQGFTDKSVQKTIRKPEEMLPKFLAAPKVRADKLLATIRAKEQAMTGRINGDTILLKVFK